MRGTVFSIEEFSVYDGPGIRTTVFMKGCPMRCSWCHNPEGQSYESQIVKSPNGCIGCRECTKRSASKSGKIIYTVDSVNNCPMNLLRICGIEYESEQLCEILLRNKILLMNGGVTFSGGEPLAQSEFVFECIKKLEGTLHTAIQTSGYCDEEVFVRALELADFFLYDLKIIDDVVHRNFTGVSNEKILKNFRILAKSSKKFVVRVPLIPTVTDTEKNLEDMAKILFENSVDYIELLPYNKMAGGKYKMLGRSYSPGFDEMKTVEKREEIFKRYGINIKVM